jgi:glutathionylspermidine synthase
MPFAPDPPSQRFQRVAMPTNTATAIKKSHGAPDHFVLKGRFKFIPK